MATGKCILRVKKLKQAGGVSGYASHNTRERETPNADPKRREANTVLVGPKTADQVMSVWRDRVSQDKNPRKNAVVALDYMIHASPKALTDEAREKYLRDALEWIKTRHGRENIVQAVIHRDERTPAHLHVIVVPLHVNKKGLQKLNASHWTDGKVKLSRMQSEFHKEVGLKHGLQRGLIGSKATHQKVDRFYGMVAAEVKAPSIKIKPPSRLTDLKKWAEEQSDYFTKEIKKRFEVVEDKARVGELSKGKIVELEGHVQQVQAALGRANKQIRQYEDVIMNKPLDEIARIREAVAKDKEQEKTVKRNRDRGGIER